MASSPPPGADSLRSALPTGVGSALVVDLDALADNLRTLRGYVGRRALWAVVKADAYGLGDVPAARTLLAAGADGLAVARLEEAEQLRGAGIKAPILLMGPLPEAIPDDPALVVTAATLDELRRLPDLAPSPQVQLEIDVGMGRRGLPPDPVCWLDDARRLGRRWTGIWAHYSHADCGPDHPAAVAQQATFHALLEKLRSLAATPAEAHLANSAGVDRLRDGETGVRVGLWLYGADPRPTVPTGGLPAPRSVVEWIAPLCEPRRLPGGHGVGYGHAHTTSGVTDLGVLAVGYADGLRADHGGRMEVWWRGERRPVRGRVSMNLTVFDLEGADDAGRGDPVWLIGPRDQANGLTVGDLAAATGRIPWEVLTAIGPRVPRIYLGGPA